MGVEEDRRAKEPKNMDARKRKAECIASGKNWEIEKLRHVGADEADKLDKRKRSKMSPDEGFASFEQSTFRKYDGLTKQIKPDMELYDRNKVKAGDAFYASAGTVVHGVHKDTPDAINRMAEDVEKQKEKREKFSRRRRHDPDSD